MNLRITVTILSLSFLAVAFQNCSQTHFTGAESNLSFKAEAIDPNGSSAPQDPMTSIGNGDDGVLIPDGTTQPPLTPSETPPDMADVPMQDPPEQDPVQGPGKSHADNPQHDPQDDPQDDNDHGPMLSASLVECELGSPSLKIKLNQTFPAEHSNDQSTRVCMTENACLVLMNTYAADRECSMALGAATSSGSTAQCTKIFPGSKGTCHNAASLSDEAISKILVDMGK